MDAEKKETKTQRRPEQYRKPMERSTSPRSVSGGQLSALPRVYIRSIKLVVYERPYQLVLRDI